MPVSFWPTLDPAIAAAEPWVDGTLHPDCELCQDFQGARSALKAKSAPRLFQVYVTRHFKGDPWPDNGLLAYRRILGLDNQVGAYADFEGYAVARALAKSEGREFNDERWRKVNGRGTKWAKTTRGDQVQKRLLRHYEERLDSEGPIFGTTHHVTPWVEAVGDSDTLALQIIGHIRANGVVGREDTLAVFELVDWCQWAKAPSTAPVISALAYACGVLDPGTGEPVARVVNLLAGWRPRDGARMSSPRLLEEIKTLAGADADARDRGKRLPKDQGRSVPMKDASYSEYSYLKGLRGNRAFQVLVERSRRRPG